MCAAVVVKHMTVFELEQCIQEYGKEVYSFCLHLTGVREWADELYQDTFLTAMEHITQLHNDANANPKSYLLSVAIRLWKNKRRKAAWRRRIAPEQSMDAPGGEVLTGETELTDSIETEVLRAEDRRQVQRAVDTLPEKYRVVVLLYYMEELPLAQIASMLHIPSGTVKSRLYQARKLLRQKLEVLLNDNDSK